MSSHIAFSDALQHGSAGSDCAFWSGLLKPPWLRIRLRFGLIMLTKPNHGPSKPVDDPGEVRLTKLYPYRLKDIEFLHCPNLHQSVRCGSQA
jgi:hypothetical protein